MTFKCIVVGVDGTQPGWRALSVAIAVAKPYHGTVHVCSVWPLTVTEERAGFRHLLLVAEVGENERQLAHTVEKELSGAGVEGDFSQREGEIAGELEALAVQL